jgi:hypothetical protein
MALGIRIAKYLILMRILGRMAHEEALSSSKR